MIGIDPTPWTAWGVLGLLGIVIIILCAIMWRLFLRQTSSMEQRDKILMEFVGEHRRETSASMSSLADKLSQSTDKASSTMTEGLQNVVTAFNRQSRALEEVLLADRVFGRISAMKEKGEPMNDENLRNAVTEIMRGKKERD